MDMKQRPALERNAPVEMFQKHSKTYVKLAGCFAPISTGQPFPMDLKVQRATNRVTMDLNRAKVQNTQR